MEVEKTYLNLNKEVLHVLPYQKYASIARLKPSAKTPQGVHQSRLE